MATHFQRSNQGGSPTSSAIESALQTNLQQITPAARNTELGFFGERKLKKERRDVILAEERRKLEIDSREAIATYEHGVGVQGIAIRSALSRIYGQAIVAEMQAMGEGHAAAVQVQKLLKSSASLVNLLSKTSKLPR